MGIVMILIPLSLLLVGVAIWAFFWAVNSGQFDDLDTPGWDILTDTTATGEVVGVNVTDDQSPVTAAES